MTLPARGLRNRNPGNVRKGPTPWTGKIDGTDAAFETFDTMSHGVRALAKILLTYQRTHELNTVAQIIDRWAPASENDTQAYVADVARRLGVAPDEPLDLDSPVTLSALVAAICWHENGVLVAEADIAAGVAMALA